MHTLAALRNLLLPTTDAGVKIQLAIVMVTGSLLLWALRRDRDLRIFVVGVWICSIAFMGLRSLH